MGWAHGDDGTGGMAERALSPATEVRRDCSGRCPDARRLPDREPHFAHGGSPRTGGQRLAIGTAIGIVFSLVQQITSLVGLLLDLNPFLAAVAPSLLLIAATQYMAGREANKKLAGAVLFPSFLRERGSH